MKQLLKNIFRINWWVSWRLNTRLLPWRDALRFPIVVYGSLRTELQGGKLILPAHAPFGTLVFGSHHETYVAASGKAQFTLNGTWQLHGPCHIGVDSCIYIGPQAYMECGKNCFLARDTQIHCFHKVLIGHDVKAGECYITDSAAHEIIRKGAPQPMTAPVIIGDRCYLGFRTIMLKGTHIPPDSVIGSGAICTRDYTLEGNSGLFLTGIPAEVREREISAR